MKKILDDREEIVLCGLSLGGVLALKKEAKRNGFDSITEYIKYLRQSLY